MDEFHAGRTLRGTPVHAPTPECLSAELEEFSRCFPAEPRDLFWQMDQVVGRDGKLQPLDFDENGDGTIDDAERDAIRGRNTWLVWGGGNEVFWGWLQEQGYGITDLLVLLDSRGRGTRFERTGLINQPGFAASTKPFLGLYLDEAKPDGSAMLRPPPGPGSARESYDGYGTDYRRYYDRPEAERYDAQERSLSQPVYRPPPSAEQRSWTFEPWASPGEDTAPFEDYVPDAVRRRLPQDGLDPAIYGYPSGIFGLRLWLNPDFFAKTDDAQRARVYWRERVENTNGRYYKDSSISADPNLVRPFRVSMSCGFCHIGPHPLNPPKDPEEPEWENLSGIIGGQYWDPQPVFAVLLGRDDFLHHFLKSQAPGTVDTSLISTDHINNTNVINAVFDVPARLARAMNKPTETQSAANLLLPSIEDPGNTTDQRHFPMVLFPGEDSVGVFGALARVYLNIGLFSEQWNRVDNPVIGFTPQRPFSIATSRTNSVFWNVNEQYRVEYLAKFFTLGAQNKVPKSTAPMRLKDAGPRGRDELARDTDEQRKAGREVFIDNCAICHSSKQPDRFHLYFERELEGGGGWDRAPAPPESGEWLVYTLPMEYEDWEDFKKSAAYLDYLKRLRSLPDLRKAVPEAGIEDPFLEDNFLSNELRIPVTLVGTYSGRAMATNAMRGQVWDNYSSETFKELESVGKIRFYNPYPKEETDPQAAPPAEECDEPCPERDPAKAASPRETDEFSTNDEYTDGRDKGGPGYYRPASLISLWATAPYFHNNALGIYTHDPSVDGRLTAFDDGIRKLLWNEKRSQGPASDRRPGDLRLDADPVARGDPGYIYRLPVDTEVAFAPGFIRPLIEGILSGFLGLTGGRVVFSILSCWLWVALVVLFVVGVMRGRARHVGVLVLGLAVLLGIVLAVTGAGGGSGGTVMGAMMMLGLGLTTLVSVPPVWLWAAVIALGSLGFWMLLTSREWRRFTRGAFGLLALLSLLGGILVNGYLNGRFSGIQLGPIPRGTPVNLLMSMDPQKTDKLPAAIVALAKAILEIKERDRTGAAAYEVFSKVAGPALIAASKVPDFVLDRGHWFGEYLSDEQKEALIAFLKTI